MIYWHTPKKKSFLIRSIKIKQNYNVLDIDLINQIEVFLEDENGSNGEVDI